MLWWQWFRKMQACSCRQAWTPAACVFQAVVAVICVIVVLELPSRVGWTTTVWKLRAAETVPAVSQLACTQAVQQGSWQQLPDGCSSHGKQPPPSVAHCDPHFRYAWSWPGNSSAAPSTGCAAEWGQVGHEEMWALLDNKRVSIIGDSHMRFLHNHLAALLGVEQIVKGEEPENLVQIANTSGLEASTTLTFSWKTNLVDVTGVLLDWELQRIVPDVLVVSSGVWHLFRGKNLIEMREEALELKSVMPRLRNTILRDTLLVWVYSPPRHPAFQVVYDEIPFEWIPVFNEAVERVGLLEPAGPFRLLDLYWLAHACLHWCLLEDGSHVQPAVNEVLLQWVLNLFRHHQQSTAAYPGPAPGLALNGEGQGELEGSEGEEDEGEEGGGDDVIDDDIEGRRREQQLQDELQRDLERGLILKLLREKAGQQDEEEDTRGKAGQQWGKEGGAGDDVSKQQGREGEVEGEAGQQQGELGGGDEADPQ